MSSKKWVFTCLILFLITIGAYGAINIFVDPFGVFGDNILDWYSYDMTNNPKVAKISYLDKYNKNYDSYIVGFTNTSSIPVDALNKYFNASFYNTFFYGQDMYDTEKMCEYLLNNYKVKNLIVDVFIADIAEYDVEIHELYDNFHAKVESEDTSEFYRKYAFLDLDYAKEKLNAFSEDAYLPKGSDVFNPKTGAYDKKARDVEPINSLDEYLEQNPGFNYYYNVETRMNEIDSVISSIERIKTICDEKDVNVIFISSPVYYRRMYNYSEADIREFFTKMIEVTDFWGFTKSSISMEERYFYDGNHIRNSVGEMIAAKISGSEDIYIPDDFGVYVTKNNLDEFLDNLCNDNITRDTSTYVSKVPVIMYHSIGDKGDGESVVSKQKFNQQMSTIKNAGFNTVTINDLVNYVEKGIELPKNPICITFDDGYLDNYTNAYPILKQHNMKATIFVIGSLVGNNGRYKNTENICNEHFSYEQAKEMVESGLISVQSHTYDMHQNSNFENTVARGNILTIDGESEEEYMNKLREDIRLSIRRIEDYVGNDVIALAYPSGVYSTLSNVILKNEGIKVTFCGEEKINEVVKGLPQSLFALRRYNITENTNMIRLIANIKGKSSLFEEITDDNTQITDEESVIQSEDLIQELDNVIVNDQIINESLLQDEGKVELNRLDVTNSP